MIKRSEPHLLISAKKLVQWFRRQKRVLPWRDEPTPYRVWISEIMLQQTQVVTVVPYFERFIARFPTVESLAEATDESVLELWAGLGYYSRARNLKKAAQEVVRQGGFPSDREGWESLPGVGPYTAGAILSIAYGKPEAIVDGNVERVFARLGRLETKTTEGKKLLWGLAARSVGAAYRGKFSPSDFNQALMELGATVCTPKNPKCLLCPLNEECRARKAGDQAIFPIPKVRAKTLHIEEEAHCVVDANDRILLVKDAHARWRKGMWDFPQTLPMDRNELEPLGEVDVKYVVTRHHVNRRVKVWRKKQGTWNAASAVSAIDEKKWVEWRDALELGKWAAGAPLKRAIRQIACLF